MSYVFVSNIPGHDPSNSSDGLIDFLLIDADMNPTQIGQNTGNTQPGFRLSCWLPLKSITKENQKTHAHTQPRLLLGDLLDGELPLLGEEGSMSTSKNRDLGRDLVAVGQSPGAPQ